MNIDIVYFDAGSGHRTAAFALKSVIEAADATVHVRVLDILDVISGNRVFYWVVRSGIAYFNWMLRRDRVIDLNGLIRLSLRCQDAVGSGGLAKISQFWQPPPPDIVVSVTPMYNPVLFRSAALANPHVTCITVPVDFEEVMPRYWVTPVVDQCYLMATPRLVEQAAEAAVPQRCIHRLGGMIIDPAFYEDVELDRNRELSKLGFSPAPTGVASFGGQGCTILRDIAAHLAAVGTDLNMIFLCGRDERLFKMISEMSTPYAKLVLAYAPEPPSKYMRLADFIIGKPGAMTITEALITRTPIIAIKSRGMHPVQHANERWVEDHGTGIVVKRLSDLPDAVAEVAGSRLYRDSCEQHRHNGIFDAGKCILAGERTMMGLAGA